MSNNKNRKFTAREGQWASDEEKTLEIPDSAIYYIVSHYLQGKVNAQDVPGAIGISSQTVEDVLQLLIAWDARNDHIKAGVMTIGNAE